MAEGKSSNFDIVYLREMFEGLSSEQRKATDDLRSNVDRMGVLLDVFSDRLKEHNDRIVKNSDDIRVLERKQNSCDASSQIKGIWYHIKRLNAFKDIVMDRSRDDSSIIDVHAMKMEKAAEEAAEKQKRKEIRSMVLRFAPWAIVVFVVGVVLATLIVVKAFSGDTLQIHGADAISSVGKVVK